MANHIDITKYPMLNARQHTPFFADLTDEDRVMNVNGSPMSQGVWNMICSHRDLKLWCRLGMKPHRGWKVSQAKAYFGIKGNKDKLLSEFEALKAEVDEILGRS
tara:strand:- start:360 stop:671 length:312 start_codon:yes stop_codon:yes gene_type:complete